MSVAHNDLPEPSVRSTPKGTTVQASLDGGHVQDDTHTAVTAVEPSPPDPTLVATPKPHSARADALLGLYADILDAFEDTRIRTENRVRAFGAEEIIGPKGGSFGKGLAGTPEHERLLLVVEKLTALEHGIELELARSLRQHPLGPWMKAAKGVGPKQGARLLAAIGDPAERRTVSQLWRYCGYDPVNPGHARADTHTEPAGVDPLPTDHPVDETQVGVVGGDPSSDAAHDGDAVHHSFGGVARSRVKGQKANWNATAKSRAFLVAEACVKAGVRKLADADDSAGYDVEHREAITPLGQIYLDGRRKYADSVHHHACRQCGPSGHPAPIGSPLSLKHKHMRAIRLVAKNGVLKGLWIEARRLRGEA